MWGVRLGSVNTSCVRTWRQQLVLWYMPRGLRRHETRFRTDGRPHQLSSQRRRRRRGHRRRPRRRRCVGVCNRVRDRRRLLRRSCSPERVVRLLQGVGEGLQLRERHRAHRRRRFFPVERLCKQRGHARVAGEPVGGVGHFPLARRRGAGARPSRPRTRAPGPGPRRRPVAPRMAAALREWSRAAVRAYLLLAACLLLLRVAQVALAGSEAVAVAVAGAVVRHAGDTLLVPFIFVHRAVRGGFELHAEATTATSKVTGISHGVAQGLVTVFFCAFASAAVRSAPAAQQVASRAKAWVESQSLGLTPADVVAFWGGASGSNRALLVGLSTALGTLLIPLLARNSHGLFALGASIGLATALAYLPNVLGTLLSSILTDFVLGGYPLTFGRIIPVLFMSKGRLHALVDVTDFAFGNPPGFPNPYFVHAKHVQVSMSCSAVRLAEFAYHCAVHGWAQVHTMSPEGDAQPHEHNVPHAIGDEEDDGNGDGVDDDFKRTIDGMNNPETIAKLTKLQARFRGISSRKLSSRLRSEYEDGEEEHAYAIHTGKSRPVGPVTPSETLMRQARRKLTVKIQRIEVNGAAVNFETHKGELNVCVLSRMLGEAEMRRLGRLPPGPLPNQLMVRVARAAGLRPADTNGLSDPYVTLRVRELVARTQVCQETLSPVWDRTFILPVDDVSAVLELDVIDKDVITADDVLGTWVMPLKRLCLDHDNAHCKGWFPLLNNDRLNDGRNGQLFLEVHWRYAPADDPSWKSALPKSARLPTPLEQITFNSRETSRRIGNFLIARRWLKLFPIHIEWEMFVLRRAHVYITDLFRGRKGSTGALRVNWLDSEPQKQEGRQSDTVKVKRLELNSRDLRGSNNTGILSLWDALYSFSLGVLPKYVPKMSPSRSVRAPRYCVFSRLITHPSSQTSESLALRQSARCRWLSCVASLALAPRMVQLMLGQQMVRASWSGCPNVRNPLLAQYRTHSQWRKQRSPKPDTTQGAVPRDGKASRFRKRLMPTTTTRIT